MPLRARALACGQPTIATSTWRATLKDLAGPEGTVEWFWIVAAAGGAGFAVKWWRDRQVTRRTKAQELGSVRRLVGEDVAYLHKQLQRLDREIGGQVLDEETWVAYRTALDSFEALRRTLEQISTAEEVSKVTEFSPPGSMRSRVQRPAWRAAPWRSSRSCVSSTRCAVPTTEVLWARPGHAARRVPACSRGADRVTNNVMPEARIVSIGAQTMPYWAAGSAFLPYTQGYFAGVAALSWGLQPAAFEAPPETGGYFGHGIVGSSGHFDGGGFAGSGGC